MSENSSQPISTDSSSTLKNARSHDSGSSTAPQPVPATPNSAKNSIVDILSTPPPVSSELSKKRSTSSISSARRLSSASQDENSLTVNTQGGAASSAGVLSSPSSVTSSSSYTNASGKDWQEVQMSELVQRENLVYVDGEVTVEEAFDILDKNKFTSLPIKINPEDPSPSETFDYADLNAYLLMLMGFVEPTDENEEVRKMLQNARAGSAVPVKFVARLGSKNELMTLKSTDTIGAAVSILGTGVHRIAVADANDPNILVGILSQRRIIRFIWENGRRFKSLEPFFQTKLSEVGITAKKVMSINGDKHVIDALRMMYQEGVSSIAVTDGSNNLLGNISIVDVRLVTKSSQKHLLRATCKHFLSIILNERGLHDGQDSYPVFHVTLNSTIGRTIAKLVATKAHRLWIVQPPQQKSDVGSPAVLTPIGATAGQLIGVVSLTDILNIMGRKIGRSDLDPQFARKQRRRSSSSSSRSQASYEALKRSLSSDKSSR